MHPNKRATWILIVGIGLMVLGLLGYLLPTTRAGLPLRIHFASAGGAVLFPHDKHVDPERGFTCAQCHHELIEADIDNDCITCHHVESFDGIDWEDEDLLDLHLETAAAEAFDVETCLDCHAHGELTQPVASVSAAACTQCHEKDLPQTQMGHNCSACHATTDSRDVLACRSCHGSGEGAAPGCADCHAGDDYQANMLEHVELLDIDGHTCDGCHVASRGSDAVHRRCNRCHSELEAGTFFRRSRDNAASVCATCHMK